MRLITNSPLKSLNKAYRLRTVGRQQIEQFKRNLKTLFGRVDENQYEEHLKNDISDFLKNTYDKDSYYINIKDRKDLVIHNGSSHKDTVGIIIEAKRPSNKSEMISLSKPNAKALHELVLYFMEERFERKNKEIKYLIATNIWEWYIFDASHFENIFFKNSKIRIEFEKWKQGLFTGNTTHYFYNEVLKPHIENELEEIECTYFNLKDFETFITKDNRGDDENLLELYKIFSPEHLLKKPFADDSNTLNKEFYNELLHIIGLTEITEGGRELIRRKPEKERDPGSMIENAIHTLSVENILQNIKEPEQFGAGEEEQLFSIALELCLLWLNRILFLKLLESQLIRYNNGNGELGFLEQKTINDFDELKELFFEVIAVPYNKRSPDQKDKFRHIPYLNSSLFEINPIEKETIHISDLKERYELGIYSSTVLKNSFGYRLKGRKKTLYYIFDFLNAYNFGSEGNAIITETSKTIINASVLGLIFEKINGYKDGSYFTPGYITMFMCRETIQRAVVQKFRDNFNPSFETFDDVIVFTADHSKKEDKKRYNEIINSLTICDPAVGSGHFLVSALNEIIALKSELRILTDEKGLPLDYDISVENDELVIINRDSNEPFNYHLGYDGIPPVSLQRVQESLFKEKQTLIENCLFGVDINPKSVMICRLRLWIELLKNAYYITNRTHNEKESQNGMFELQTLPNIDINIKCGNSLVNRYDIYDRSPVTIKDADIIRKYRQAIKKYYESTGYKQKQAITAEIENYKMLLKGFVLKKSMKEYKLREMKEKHYEKFNDNNHSLIVSEPKLTYSAAKDRSKQTISKLEAEIKREKEEDEWLYSNALEWRFEFPQVLDDNGNFTGFDVVIANPPYIKEYVNRKAFDGLRNSTYYKGKMDIWYFFACTFIDLLVKDGLLCFIAQNNWITSYGASIMRNKIIRDTRILNMADFYNFRVFDKADIQTMVMLFKKDSQSDNYKFDYRKLSSTEACFDDVMDMLNHRENPKVEYMNPIIEREKYIDKLLTFSNTKIGTILNKILKRRNFKLEVSEIGNGIHHHHDCVNRERKNVLGDKFNIGDGIFVISDKEKKSIHFLKKELELIKPSYTTKELNKYYAYKNNLEWVIYTDSTFKEPENIKPYPNIKAHLDKFQQVITSDNKPYGLHRARDKKFFKGEKIIAVRKCSQPTFSYTDFDCYVSAAFYIIKTSRINLKFLTGVLNSKLIAFWLQHKGKMQGSIYQVDKEPLLELPLISTTKNKEQKIIKIIDKILEIKTDRPDAEISKLEKELNAMVYKLYDLNEDEVKIIDPDFEPGNNDYSDFKTE